MKKIYISVLLALVVLAAVGCSASQSDVIGIRGEVTNINTSGDTIMLLVEGDAQKDTVYDKASVTVKPETKVVRRQDGTDSEISADEIKLYDKVEIIFDGPIAESYPVQGAAKLVRILS